MADAFSPDETDSKILNIIGEHAKLSYRKIAARTGVSTATVLHRVRAMEKAGVIRGYHTSIDYEKLGYEFTVIVDIRIAKGMLAETEKKIASLPNVYALYDITGSFDTMMLAKFQSRRELDTFLKAVQRLEFIERTETKIILSTVKEEHIKVK